jgi:hypothetical protein
MPGPVSKMKQNKLFKKIISGVALAAVLAAGIFINANAAETTAKKTTAKKAGELAPVIDSAPPIYVPEPGDDPMGETGVQPYLDPSLLDPALMPLSLPSDELGDAMPHLISDFAPSTGFDPIVLTDLRKKVEGTLIFEDKNRNVFRVEPKNSGPRRLFRGSQPAADPAGKRIAYVDWDQKSVFLYIYDISNSARKSVYSTPDLVSMPVFSPNGKILSFVTISMTGGDRILYALDIETGKKIALAKNLDFFSYSWNPADSSIWLTVRSCPDGVIHQSLCYARIAPDAGKIEYKTIAVNDAVTGRKITFEIFQKPGIRFSGNGHLLIYDGDAENDYFYDVALDTMTAGKRAYKQPDGKNIIPRDVQWGLAGKAYAMNYEGNVWVKIPDVEQPFPAVTGFSVFSAVIWIP